MQPRKIEIEIPEAMAGYIHMDNEAIKSRMEKLMLVDLVHQGIISCGKAAELAGTDKMSFIMDMGNMGIPYFSGLISDVLADADTVKQTMKVLPS